MFFKALNAKAQEYEAKIIIKNACIAMYVILSDES